MVTVPLLNLASTILVTLDAGHFHQEHAFDNGFSSYQHHGYSYTDQHLTARPTTSGRSPPACLSSTFRVACWSVPSSATYSSSVFTAQLHPVPAHYQLSFAPVWHMASPHVGLPSAQPLCLASAYHGTARLTPGLFASTTQRLTLAWIATKVFLYRTCTYPRRQGCCSAARIRTSDLPDPCCSNSDHSRSS